MSINEKIKIKGKELIELIPQRHPFVMIDNLFHSNDKLTRTSFSINEKNVLCRNKKFTEAGLIENMAQTAAVGAGYEAKINNTKIKTGFIGAIKNLKIYELPNVNQEIITEVKTDYIFDNVSIISSNIKLNNKIIAECEMKIFLQ